MKGKIGAVVLGILLAASVGIAAGSPPDLATADWSVKQVKTLNAEPDDAVWKFMNNLWGNTDLSAGDGKVCEFHFAELRHSGTLSLVVSDDGGGIADCDSVEVFDQTPMGIEYYDFNSLNISYLDGVEDINGDGNNNLIVDTAFTPYAGARHCMATWPVIYAWTGSGYSDVSSKYKSYYNKQLASLQREISVADSQGELPSATAGAPSAVDVGNSSTVPQSADDSSGSSGSLTQSGFPAGVGLLATPSPRRASSPAADNQDLDCPKAEAAKIERFLGISHDAGIGDAIQWAKSDDPARRRFAADILAEIGTAEAIEDLQTLSGDPDRNVAMSAKAGLARIKTPAAENPTIQGELLTPKAGNPPAK